MRKSVFSIMIIIVVSLIPGHASALQWDTDRPGSDFSNFNLSKANPRLCQKECLLNPQCKAWTYVKPNTTQGPSPRCWLKHSVPAPKPDSCCVSGVKLLSAPTPPTGMEWNVDRPGSDYSNFNLPHKNPGLCAKACAQDANCRAWTYVKPNTIQGPSPRCWLKHSVPMAKTNNCCVSGVK
jgi:hypothetical protein